MASLRRDHLRQDRRVGLRGEIGVAIPVGGLGLLGWVSLWPASFAGRTQKSTGQVSRVRTAFLEMELCLGSVYHQRENDMRFMERGLLARATAAAGLFVLSLALTISAARAQEKTYMMKITFPTLNDANHQFAKNFAAAVERDSGGRIKGEVYPASQLGSIPRQIEGVQFGAIQVAVIPPEFFVGVDERFQVMAAPGLVDSPEHESPPTRRC